jgi:hypothetical protein
MEDKRLTKIEPVEPVNPVRPIKRDEPKSPQEFGDKLDKAISERLKKRP